MAGYRMLTPEQVVAEFGFYHTRIERALVYGEAGDTAEKVFRELLHDRARLLTDEQDNFAVLTLETDHNQQKYLYLWVLQGKDVLFGKGLDECKKIAAALGCVAIKFASTRQAWSRVAQKLGFNKVVTPTLYEMEISKHGR